MVADILSRWYLHVWVTWYVPLNMDVKSMKGTLYVYEHSVHKVGVTLCAHFCLVSASLD